MSKFIPYHIVCPLASCTRSNTCARYANYLKAKAEADSFEVLNLDHLKIAGDSCPYHLVTERQRWARGFARLCDSIPKGNSRYLNIYPPPLRSAASTRQRMGSLHSIQSSRKSFSASLSRKVPTSVWASTAMKKERFIWRNSGLAY